MTAKEEDILTNQNYLAKGIAIDKLLQSLIVTPNVDYNQLLLGDKNAIMIAARILSYGKDYEFTYNGESAKVDLSTFNSKNIDESLLTGRLNDFKFTLPTSKNEITFKFLSHGDEKSIEKELEGLKKINKDDSSEGSTRLKYIITSVNGSREQADIRKFVDTYLLAKDARELRAYYSSISPDVDMKGDVVTPSGIEEGVDIPITLNFFWPDFRV